MKKFYDIFCLSSLAIGSIIGAGFVSGREIISFFFGQDIFLSCIFTMVGFFVGLSFLFCLHKIKENKFYFVLQPVILVANLIIMSGMLSAIDSLQETFFSIDKKYPILSIIALVISNIVLSKGIKGIENVNFFLVPVIVLILIFVCLSKSIEMPALTYAIKPVSLIEYVGLNIFMSAILFIDAGEKYKKSTSIISSFIVSLILTVLIALISLSFYGENDKILSADIPLLYFARNTYLLFVPYCICLVLGIFTTLISSHYPLFCIIENKQYTILNRIVLSVVAVLISRMGFYNIVKDIYPILGFVGASVLVVISILTVFSPKRRQANTLIPLTHKE